MPSTPASPSPSPPPSAPPTLSTPGPRASTLQKLFNEALAHTLKTCSYSNFASCFPTPARYVPEELDGFYRAFIGRLESNCKNEFANLLEERNVIASLNELDELIADARRRKEKADAEAAAAAGSEQSKDAPSAATATATATSPTPPHLLPPSSLLNAHLAPFLASQRDELVRRADETHDANKKLAAEVNAQRTEIENLVGGLEGLVADLESAAAALQGEEMEGVEGELVKGVGV